MTDDNDLNKQLNRPPVPHDLEDKIRANWQEQKMGRRHTLPLKTILVAASIIGIVAGTVLIDRPTTPEDLITIAINDIDSDTLKRTGLTLPIDSILNEAHINLPPESMPIKMTKRCNLNGNKAVHIKVAGANQGAVHLFIKTGDFDTSLSLPDKETATAMPWKLIKPRHDLTVLVLYTTDMNPTSVDKLLETMFYV